MASMPRPVAPPADRERESQRLRSAVQACVEGRSTVVEVTGDPGLGKTRLLAELAARARESGLAVLSGRASEYERDYPFGVVAEALRSRLEAPERLAEAAVDDRTRELLELAFAHPSKRDPSCGSVPPVVERFRLFGAVARLLEGTSRAGGVLLCLDDLHWADEGSLELLRHLLRYPPQVPVILACAYRPRQARPRLLTCLSQTADGYRAERLRLTPLDRRAADELLGTSMPQQRRAALYAASGGNPLYLEVLARLTVRPQEGDAARFADLPRSLRAALVREVALLTPPQLTVLRAAAVLGDPFQPALLATVADLPPVTALAALDTLARMDLVRPGGSGRMLEFRHPLLREVISGDSPPGWWLAAQGRADRALRVAGAGPVERAPHVVRSAEPGDLDAVRLLCEASEHVMYSVPATAASWLRAALQLLKPTATSGEPRFDVLLALARALGLTGDLAGFREALGEAMELLPSGRRGRRVEVVVLQAQMERILGSVGEARAVLEAELSAWPETSAVANPLRLELATVRMIQRAYDESAAHLDTASHHAARTGDRGTRTAAAACRALGAAYGGETVALLAHATRAATAVDAMEDEELTALLDPLSQLGWAELLAGRYDDSVRHIGRGVRIARRTGQSHVLPYLLLGHTWAVREVGQLTEAVESAEAAEEMAHLLGKPDLVGYAVGLRAKAIMLRDDPASAAPLAERALRTVRARGRLWALTAGVLATIRFEQGRLDDCVTLMQDVVDRPLHCGPTHSVKAGWYSTAAQAEAARGRSAAAHAWAQRAEEAAGAVGLRGQLGHAAVARACALGTGGVDAAVELLVSASADFHSTGQVLEEVRVRLSLTHVLSLAGSLDEAVENAGRAKQTAAQYGARHLYTQAVNAQRRIGALGPRARAAATSVLSRRERAVAEMAGRGLSNRDIAELMFVSVKTVEAHLTRAFRKLEVGNRWALSQVFGTAGAAQDGPTAATPASSQSGPRPAAVTSATPTPKASTRTRGSATFPSGTS
ncbi:ATP-binding protein [Streptomyces sp. NPDC060048]|uniref:ATP-binding protein n=1 Tax=unclassified Streptomyces TaxID=2593676 RepID=UPI0036BF257B